MAMKYAIEKRNHHWESQIKFVPDDIDFIGKNDFEAIDYKLSFSTDTNMTSDDVRKRTLEYIKIGLVRFWIEKNTLNDIKVEVPGPVSEEEEKKEVEDPWDYWVFGISVSGYFNGQETSNYSSLNSNVSVKRVTEKNKFSLLPFPSSKVARSIGLVNWIN